MSQELLVPALIPLRDSKMVNSAEKEAEQRKISKAKFDFISLLFLLLFLAVCLHRDARQRFIRDLSKQDQVKETEMVRGGSEKMLSHELSAAKILQKGRERERK